MLKTAREKSICAKYSAWDVIGNVHCAECPLNLRNMHPKEFGRYDFMCKANSHYDRHKQEWVPDEVGEE